MENLPSPIITFVFLLLLFIALFLIFRAVVLWYFNITTIIEKQTKTINVLNNILEELQKKNLPQ
jgi:hypothetical protein